MLKKAISFIFAVCFILTFSACSEKNHVDSTVTTGNSEVENTKNTDISEAGNGDTEADSVFSVIPVLSGIEADSIQYYNCSESGNFAVIEKNGKYGIIDYDGELILPISYEGIYRGGGYAYDFLVIEMDDDYWNNYIDANGEIQRGYPDGGDVKPSAYWYKDSIIILNDGSGVMTLEEFINDGAYGSYGLKAPGLVFSLRAWNSDKLFPIQEIDSYTSYSSHGYVYHIEPHLTSNQFAFMDMETCELISDFVYEDIDNYNGVSEGLLAVKQNGKWGFVNESGEAVIDFLYEPYEIITYYGDTTESVYTAVNGYITVLKDGKWGLLDTQGNIVLETAYDGISQVNPDGLFWLEENGSWTLYKIEN